MLIKACPVCGHDIKEVDLGPLAGIGSISNIECQDCGSYYVGYQIATTPLYGALSVTDYRHVSAWIRDRWRRGEKSITVLPSDITAVLSSVPRLTPAERANRMLIRLAELTKIPGRGLPRDQITASDVWGEDAGELGVYALWLLQKGFIWPYAANGQFCLSLAGWAEVDRLQQQRAVSGKLAFMAMPFGDPRLDSLVAQYFAPAIKAAGFDLRRLDQGQPAGLIDDQLRVRIRTARFVVADLTHGNNGAYWEAGFAEGLGRPVIYSCEKSVFTGVEGNKRTHFDTNHLVTVLWESGNFAEAASKLKAIVRATFPGEAMLED